MVPGNEHAISSVVEVAAILQKGQSLADSDNGYKPPPSGTQAKRKPTKTKSLEHALQLIVGVHPVALYLRDLHRQFGRYAYFHYDQLGGHVIAITWKPNVLHAREFSVAHAAYAKPYRLTQVTAALDLSSYLRLLISLYASGWQG